MLITEGQLRLIIREELIREVDESPVLYTGIVLKPDFVYALRDMIIGLGYDEDIDGWELSNIAAHGNEQLNHHMTLTVGALKPNDPLKDSLGKEVKLRVIGWGVDPHVGVAAWKVELPSGITVKTGNPHITAALSGPDVKPFLASKISDWQPLDEPFTVIGTLQEVRKKLTNTQLAEICDMEQRRFGIGDMEQRHFGLTAENVGKIVDIIMLAKPDRGFLTAGKSKKISDMFGVSTNFIGRGRHRTTFSISDRFIVKIATHHSGQQANKEDHILGTDKEIGHIFPRAYFHDEDFKWIVLERVTPFKGETEVAPYFKSKYLVDPASSKLENSYIYMKFIREIILDDDHFFDETLVKDIDEELDYLWKQTVRRDGSFDRDTITIGDIRWDLMKTPTFLNLWRAIKKHYIATDEIASFNMGITDDGSLVLLDSSMS